SDPKRLSRAPRTLRPLALLLDEIDGTLADKLAAEGLAPTQGDFAYTLPLAVAATSHGFQRCPPAVGWDALNKEVNQFWIDKQKEGGPLLHLLPNSYNADPYNLRVACDRLHALARDCIPTAFPPPSAKQMFARHAIHFTEAKAVS